MLEVEKSEFRNTLVDAMQKQVAKEMGYKLIDYRLELYAVPIEDKDQKNKEDQRNSLKIDKLKSMFDKVKFVAKNVIYVKKWSENTLSN